MQGSAGVMAMATPSLGNFLFGAAGLEASIGLEGDAWLQRVVTALPPETSCTFSPRRERLKFAAERV
jgi:hypothetical protein